MYPFELCPVELPSPCANDTAAAVPIQLFSGVVQLLVECAVVGEAFGGCGSSIVQRRCGEKS